MVKMPILTMYIYYAICVCMHVYGVLFGRILFSGMRVKVEQLNVSFTGRQVYFSNLYLTLMFL